MTSRLVSLRWMPAIARTEIGSPFPINAPGYFIDASTQDNVHIAFTQPIDPSWTPPG